MQKAFWTSVRSLALKSRGTKGVLTLHWPQDDLRPPSIVPRALRFSCLPLTEGERVGVQTVRTCLFFALVVFLVVVFLRCGHLL